jgi:MoxR-like ATPase
VSPKPWSNPGLFLLDAAPVSSMGRQVSFTHWEIPMTVRKQFAAFRKALNEGMIERQAEIDLALTALISREHVLFVGPPGTGKSMLSDYLLDWMDGNKFSILLNKFTVPEEVFGPVSLSGLKKDIYNRIITGKLPEATIAFMDEIFKASSAILNTTLKVLNEREFQNGNDTIECPLQLCIAASNEWPSADNGKELGALFDRFLFRKHVRPVSTERGLDRLLWGDVGVTISDKVTPEDIAMAHDQASTVPWTDDAKESLMKIIKDLRHEGIFPGDRRLRKSRFACQAYAWLNECDEVQSEHLEILAHVLWEDPAEQPKKVAQVIARAANPAGMAVNSLMVECEQIVASTDPRNLSQAALAAKKLNEMIGKLKAMKTAKAAEALAYVSVKLSELKEATLSGM